MVNEYGLDVSYFRDKLKLIVRDVSRYTPREMATELSRLEVVANDQAEKKEVSSGEDKR